MPNKLVQAAAEGLPREATKDFSSFPIPYRNQSPADDMRLAVQFLRVVDRALERASGCINGLSQAEGQDMLLVLNQATRLLDAIQLLLDDARVPSHLEVYQSVRMAEILDMWEIAQ